MSVIRFGPKVIAPFAKSVRNPWMLKEVPNALFTGRLPSAFTSTKTYAFTPGPGGFLLADASISKADVMGRRGLSTSLMKEILKEKDFSEVLKKIEENPKDLGFIRDLYPELREKVALHLANTNPKLLAPMTNFNILNKECFKEVIQILLKKDPSDLIENNEANSRYKFTESEWKIIVDVLIEEKPDAYGSHVFRSIMWDAKFTKEDLAEITPKLLEKDLKNVPGYIHKLNLNRGEKYLVADKLIDVNPGCLVLHIFNFDLYFLQFIRIVDKLTDKHPQILINNFYNFDSRDRVRVAQNLVHSNPGILIRNISKFKLSEFGLKEIARDLAEKHPDFLAQNISAFKLKEEDRKEIALKLLLMEGPKTHHHDIDFTVTHNFQLTEASLADIGHRLIEKGNINPLLKNPRVFKLDYEDRKKVADSIVKREPPYFYAATHISNLELTKEDLKEYAYKLLDIEESIEDLVKNIHLFRLDPVDLKCFANKLLDKHVSFLVQDISKFNLKGADLVEIVQKLPDDALKSLLKRLDRIFDQKDSEAIAHMLVEKNPEVLIENWSTFNNLAYGDFSEIFSKLVDKKLGHLLLKKLTLPDELILMIFKKQPELFPEFGNKLPLEARATASNLYGEWLHTEKGHPMTGSEVELIAARVVKYSHLGIRESSSNVFLEQISSASYQSIYGEYTKSRKKNEPIFTVHKALPAVFLSKWQAELKESIEPSKLPLLEFLNNPEIRLALRREVGCPLMQNLLLAMIALDKDSSLGPKEKCNLLGQICNVKAGQAPAIQEISDTLGQLAVICNRNEGATLNYTFTKSAKEEVSLACTAIIIKYSYANVEGIENFEEKYQKTFGSTLIPGALQIYEEGLRSLWDPNVLRDLTRLVRSVLEGSSEEERYRTDINPNLLEISTFPEVFAKWKESSPSIIVDSGQPHELLSFKDFFQNQARTLPPEERSLLPDLKNGKPSYVIKENETKEEKRLRIVGSNYTKLVSEENLSSEEQLASLYGMQQVLPFMKPEPRELIKSVQECITLLKTPPKQKGELVVKDSGDTLLNFQIPTLVSSSCQNITATAGLNRCLIAYAIDGSIRMITVQDSSGKFLARSGLRIVLDDKLQPVLLLEPMYSNSADSNKMQKAILQMGRQKAKELGIPLLMRGDGSYKGSVNWLGSSCKYSYSDLMGGILTDAKTAFSIVGLQDVTKEAAEII